MNNQLVGYTYDAAGNLMKNSGTTYYYDAENRLIQVNGTFGNCSTATQCYGYDAFGRRTEKVGQVATSWNDRIYDLSDRVVAQASATGGVAAYIYLNGSLVTQYSNATTYFVQTDHLGSTRTMTCYAASTTGGCSGSQVVRDSMDFLPFGEQISGDTASIHKFTGKERDGESGNDYFGARYYSSTMGRFMTPDWAARPIAVPYALFGDPQSLNLYGYVRNDPVTHADLDGHAGNESPCPAKVSSGGSAPSQCSHGTAQNKSWWQKLAGVFYAKGSVGAGLEVGVEGHIGKAKSPIKVGAKIGADVKSTMTVTTEGTNVSATKEAQAGVNIGKVIIGPQTSTEDVTVKNGQPLANHEVEKSSSLVFGTERAEGTLSKGDIGVGAEVDAVFISVGIELGVDFDKVKELFSPDK